MERKGDIKKKFNIDITFCVNFILLYKKITKHLEQFKKKKK